MVLLVHAFLFPKKRSNVDMVLQDARGATAHGGQLIVDALAKDFGLWEKIRACACMDPRKDKSRGFFPEPIIEQHGWLRHLPGETMPTAPAPAFSSPKRPCAGGSSFSPITIPSANRGDRPKNPIWIWFQTDRLSSSQTNREKPGRGRQTLCLERSRETKTPACREPMRAFPLAPRGNFPAWRAETSPATPRNSLRPSGAAKIQRS